MSTATVKVRRFPHMLLDAMEESERTAAMETAEAFQKMPPEVWPADRVTRLNPPERKYLVRVTPDLRAVFLLNDANEIEVIDVMREELFQQLLKSLRRGEQRG